MVCFYFLSWIFLQYLNPIHFFMAVWIHYNITIRIFIYNKCIVSLWISHLWAYEDFFSGKCLKGNVTFQQETPQFRRCECAYEAWYVKHTYKKKKWNALQVLDTWEICDTADRVSEKWWWAAPKQKRLWCYLTDTVTAQRNGGWPRETFWQRAIAHLQA